MLSVSLSLTRWERLRRVNMRARLRGAGKAPEKKKADIWPGHLRKKGGKGHAREMNLLNKRLEASVFLEWNTGSDILCCLVWLP